VARIAGHPVRWQNAKNVSFALIHVVDVDNLIFL
jgi:hypothetical protein